METEFKKKKEAIIKAHTNARLILKTLLYEGKITKNTFDELLAWLYEADKEQLSWNDVFESIFNTACPNKDDIEGFVAFGPYHLRIELHNETRKNK